MQEIQHHRIPFITLSGVTKSFSGHTALHPVSLEIHPGEFHALIGENGAGKSTLINLVTGVYKPDAGSMTVASNKIDALTPSEANALGIYAVHQELSLCRHLTIMENIFLGKEKSSSIGLLRKKEMWRISKNLLNEVELSHLDPNTPVQQLPLAEQQIIEFVKAIYQKPSLLILDEATSALDPNQVGIMFNKLRELKKEGMSVIFISHRLQELFDLCDRLTVLKDGQQIATDTITQFNHTNLIELMTGRPISDLFPTKQNVGISAQRQKVLQVDKLKSKKLKEASFSLHKGEILGIGGLQGQGQEDILKALFGIDPIIGGTIEYNGRKINLRNPRKAMKEGFAYIPADRKTESLLLPHSIRFNTSLASLNNISDLMGTVKSKLENELVDHAMRRLQVKAQSMEQTVNSLSGGNQQKIALSKWLERQPNLLLLNDPTRGIDVGTKQQIYELLRTLSDSGVAIILVSSDALELIGLCDRVIVIYEYQVNGELKGEELTEQNLVRASVLKQ